MVGWVLKKRLLMKSLKIKGSNPLFYSSFFTYGTIKTIVMITTQNEILEELDDLYIRATGDAFPEYAREPFLKMSKEMQTRYLLKVKLIMLDKVLDCHSMFNVQ
jgi:hypothetical protein